MTTAKAADAWRAYFEGTALLTAELERRLKEHSELDLADFNVLLVLSEAPGERLRLGVLARQLAFAPGRLTYRMGSLEERGLVKREAVECDRRGIDAVLTDEGRRVLRRVRPAHARDVRELFLDAITDDEASALSAVFTPLRERLHGGR